jgi:hypothetical protein
MSTDLDDDGDDMGEDELTPIERAIYEERALMREIRILRAENAQLRREIGCSARKLVEISEERSAMMLRAALAGAFDKPVDVDASPLAIALGAAK